MLEELCRDQAYLYKIILEVRTGVVDENLIQAIPGPMSMAKWVTTASRVCRLHVATCQSNIDLFSLTHFVVTNCGPRSFKIKFQLSSIHESKHLLEQVKIQSLLPSSIKKVTWPIVQRCAYWAHQENVLLAMLADDDAENRKPAIGVIKKNCESSPDTQGVWEFRPALIHDSSKTLQDFLPSIEHCKWKPPLVKHISDGELNETAERSIMLHIPGDSQGVERCIRTVTEAAGAVYGREARDAYIRAVVRSRHVLP